MTDVKPCPFCGREPEISFIMVDEPVTNFDKYYEIHCPACLHEGLRIRHTVRNLMNENEHTIAKENLAYEWNKKINSLSDRLSNANCKPQDD